MQLLQTQVKMTAVNIFLKTYSFRYYKNRVFCLFYLPVCFEDTCHTMTIRGLIESNWKVVGNVPSRWDPRPKPINRKHFGGVVVLNDFTHCLNRLLVGICAVDDFGSVMERVWISRISIGCGKVDSETTVDLSPPADIF